MKNARGKKGHSTGHEVLNVGIASVMADFDDRGYRYMTTDGIIERLERYYAKLGFEPRFRFRMLTNKA